MNSKMCKKDTPQAVILADDFTAGLAPSQKIFPSILTPVLNVPLFDYMIEMLIKSEIEEIFLYCSGHVEMLKKYVKEKNYNITISLIISDGCRSLGEALRDIDAKGCIRGCFVLIRGNAFINTDLKALLNAHRLKVEKDKGATMTMVLRNIGSAKDSFLSREVSQIVSVKRNNKILHCAKLKNSGKKLQLKVRWFREYEEIEVNTCHLDTHIYLCSSSVLPLFADNFGFQTMGDFIRGVLMSEEILDSRIYWEQIKVDDYALPITSWKAYHILIQDILNKNSFSLTLDAFSSSKNFRSIPRRTYKHRTAILATGCILKDSILGHNSVLGNNTKITKAAIADNCVVGSEVTISSSYIFSNVKIEDNCTIANSIIFSNCVISSNSQIDGCILCPEIKIDGEYVDTIVESACSGLSKTKMSELDDDEFLYFKDNRDATAKHDDDGTESSSSETNSMDRNSPIPDDTNMFLSEVIDSLLRGYQDKLNCENLILEINSSRYAYNVTICEVTYNVIKAILSLPLHYLCETKTPVDNQTYQKNLKIMLKYFDAIILNYMKNKDAQNDCLRAIEDVASTTDELLPYVQRLLHQFYDRDILSEEKILEWYESSSEDADVHHAKIRDAVQPFVKWLREAEEDSSSEKD